MPRNSKSARNIRRRETTMLSAMLRGIGAAVAFGIAAFLVLTWWPDFAPGPLQHILAGRGIDWPRSSLHTLVRLQFSNMPLAPNSLLGRQLREQIDIWNVILSFPSYGIGGLVLGLLAPGRYAYGAVVAAAARLGVWVSLGLFGLAWFAMIYGQGWTVQPSNFSANYLLRQFGWMAAWAGTGVLGAVFGRWLSIKRGARRDRSTGAVEPAREAISTL